VITNSVHHYDYKNLYALYISNVDVTDIFKKYRTSILIKNNLNAHVLYLYYCYKTKYSNN
jgi:hypothetical protein